MPAPYSMDLRERVWAAFHGKEGTEEEVAERCGVSPSFVRDLVRRQRETGSIAPKPHGGGRHPIADENGLKVVAQVVAEHSDATLEELCRELARKRKGRPALFFSSGSLSRALKKLRLTRKKERPARHRA